MLSFVESNQEITQALREADRAAAAPYIDYPPTPRWYPVATGVWVAALCLALAIRDHHVLRALALVSLIAVEVTFLAWYRRYRGTWPRGRAPREIRQVMAAFVVGAASVVLVVGLVLWLTNAWLAATAAFALATPAVTWYERAYAAAAARARARLG